MKRPHNWLTLSAFMLLSAVVGAQSNCIGEQGVVQWFLYENVTTGTFPRLLHRPNFPQSPTWVEDLPSLASPIYYNNNYGSLIRGYIKAPETGGYVFNMTGDDYCQFYLSTDSTDDNLVLRCDIVGYTGTTEHTKYPSQTSATVQLTAGNYYYFEAMQKEGGGGDFIWIHWKTPSTINSPDWEIVHGTHLYKYECEPACPAAGTPCNDGNASTVNDQQDGDCRCIGTPASPPSTCIGDRGGLVALYYDGITGSFVSSMLAAAKYPEAPDRANILPNFEGPVSTGFNSYGTRARGYLRPPVTGNYRFNVTGDNEVRLRLRVVAGDTATAADEIAFNDGFAEDYDHYNTPQQTSAVIALTAGNFYAIELLHKENTGSDDFFVFWKTPYARDTSWHVIDGTYLYRYKCEWACIPNNTPCNDNNANTFNDVFTNCACAGTPCSDPECTNSLDYTPLEPCDTTENHSTNPNASWLSCQSSQNPNPQRGMSHWIQYDFGDIYALDDAKIWNYNAAGATGQGFNQVVIDVSFDGVNWSELGTYNWAQATGNGNYEGFISTVFQGVSARYVLLTAVSNFNGSNCFGVSEIYFNAETCPPAGTPCDDGDPETINDAYNEFCYCVGDFNLSNDCDVVHLVKNEIPIQIGEYDAELTINSAGYVRTGFEVVFLAGESITLNGGFEVEIGAEFFANIVPCDQNSFNKTGKQKRKKKKLD